MNVDGLITRLVRQLNRQVLNFPAPSADTSLPVPEAGKTYLLYLHIPYCQVLCPFCSFHHVQFKHGSASRYFECLRREIDIVTADGYVFDELYVGGGTPTVLPAELIATLQQLRDRHPLTSISVETNPDDLQKDALLRLRDAGVDRLSIGVQSFDDDLLREMERFDKYGSGDDIKQRLRTVRGAYDTVNVDMIFNLPHQSEASLQRDLDILIDELDIDQVSFYPLMVADTTKKTLQRAMGDVDRSRERRYYELIAERMLGAGYERSSSWCFSRRAGMFDEYIADREEYVGLGSGAFSYLQGGLYASTFSISHYKLLVNAGKTGIVRQRNMSERDQMRYLLLMQLFGGSLDKNLTEARFDGRFQRKLWPELIALKTIGAIRDTGDAWVLTENGQFLWVLLMREFFSGINSLREQMKHNTFAASAVRKTGE